MGAENLVPTGIQPRTVQPVGSRYTDYATRPIGTLMDDNKSLQTVHKMLKQL